MEPQDDGNARVRALKAGLLRPATYGALLGRDVSGVLASLAATAYRAEVQAALARHAGLPALQRAVREKLASRLRGLPRLFRDGARHALRLLLTDLDVRNVLVILRGTAARRPPEEMEPLLVPAGALDAAALSELARVPDMRALADRLASEGIPSRAAGAAALAAAAAPLSSASAIESALLRAHARATAAALADAPPLFAPVADALRAEIDARNAVLALRGRAARRRGERPRGEEQGFLIGGTLRRHHLEAAAEEDGRAEAAAHLVPAAASDDWRQALAAWAGHGDLAALERALDAAVRRRAMRGFHGDDPASLQVPVAWAAAIQAEAANLRRIGAGAAIGESPENVRADLILAPGTGA